MHALSDEVLRALPGERLLPFRRRSEILSPAAVRALVADAVAPPIGRGAAGRVAPGRACRWHTRPAHWQPGPQRGGGRHPGPAEADRVPRRCAALPSRPRETG